MVCVQITFGNEGEMKGYECLNQRELKKNERRIPTGLVGIKAHEVLESVIGQMSDGKWENTPGYDKYWMFCDIDKDNSIIVNDGCESHGRDYRGYTRWVCSGFREMNEEQVRAFFARKIRAVVKDFKEYYGNDPEQECDYLSYHEEISVKECLDIAKALVKYRE